MYQNVLKILVWQIYNLHDHQNHENDEKDNNQYRPPPLLHESNASSLSWRLLDGAIVVNMVDMLLGGLVEDTHFELYDCAERA